VLGADNKSAVTVVMTVLENLTPEHRHGDIVVAFVRMKRWACGAKALDLSRFAVDFAWTIDCCERARSCMRTLMPRRRRFALPA
jgi:tripeptide aminopeptidase